MSTNGAQILANSKAADCLDVSTSGAVRLPNSLSGNVSRPNRADGLIAGSEARGNRLDYNTVDVPNDRDLCETGGPVGIDKQSCYKWQKSQQYPSRS